MMFSALFTPSQALTEASDQMGSKLDGVTTFWELGVPLATRLADALGLPHNPVQAVECARNKVCDVGVGGISIDVEMD